MQYALIVQKVVITQKLTSSLAQVAVKSESKPMKIPLIVFGAGMFGKDAVKLKGHRCGVVGKLFRTLKRREAEGRLKVG
ncbi:hypothetical protein HMPREF1544_11350 [Mucor circinelloides 1006PhL]|uniref:Uncharacterized protein n=1 Tax=Mucor circinelloides f. circinelloides (strain 1006PhL) TaxID=1220926 RepID=S2IXD4_MUCC1|nr:hypothetical protein HMPREF1544_11350 [Mucor circinelloides 1006PhL]